MMNYQHIEENIVFFLRKAEENQQNAYRNFLYIAAQPLLFSTDLLYKLWLNFKGYRQDNPPYWLVSDFISSNLCHPVGVDLFRMEEATREYLRKHDEKRPIYEPQNPENIIKQVATFVEVYIGKYKSKISPHIYTIHEIFVEGILRPHKLAERIRENLQKPKKELQDYEKVGYLNLYLNASPINEQNFHKAGISLSYAREGEEGIIISAKNLPESIKANIKMPNELRTLRDILEENLATKNPFLDLSNLGLTGLEPELELLIKCTHLTHLDLSKNQLEGFFPEEGVKLSLILQTTRVTKLTYIIFLYCIYNLETLYISFNNITHFDLGFFHNFKKIKNLHLKGNPLNLPNEIFNKDENALPEVRDYLEYIMSFPRELNEAKLLIVGVGGVGKSEMAKRLSERDYEFMANSEITHGISIKEWHIPFLWDGKEQDFRANIWDFAGQEINYGTHQFFLTKNSVYVFLWETRKGELQSNFEYWLNIVSLLSENAPIFVVQNKIDIYESELNQAEWLEKHPNIVGFCKTSCNTGEGISELRNKIKQQLIALPSTREIWNKHQYAVRRILESMKEDYIDYRTYLKICEENTLTREEAGFLAKQLHDIGVILQFEDISLRDTVVLNPNWVTDAMYCLLDTKTMHNGQFRRQDLGRIWAGERFEGKYAYLLELMQRFELVFQFDGDTYIVPEGLPIQSPAEEETTMPTLRFEYHYEFMPRTILSRFICRMHRHIKERLFWRFGVVLEYGNTIAHVHLNDVGRILRIEIWGQDAGTFLQIIRSNIDHIHQDLKNPPLTEKVPCVCKECRNSANPYLHDYNVLLKAQERGKSTRECYISAEDVPISLLLEGFRERRDFSLYDYLNKGDFAGFFMKMEKQGVAEDLLPTFMTLKADFIMGKTSLEFENRLRAFAREMDRH